MNYSTDKSSDPVPAKSGPAITSTGRIRAIPPAFMHIQANSCKTPGCLNFGVPPRAGPVQTGRGAAIDNYAIINTGSFTHPCRLCGKSSTLKNNAAIHQEMVRQGDGLWETPGIRCRNDACVGADPTLATFSAIPCSDAYRKGLTSRADHVFHEDCGDLACWWLVLGDRSVISETAALADQAGLIVAESADGWTAISPTRNSGAICLAPIFAGRRKSHPSKQNAAKSTSSGSIDPASLTKTPSPSCRAFLVGMSRCAKRATP